MRVRALRHADALIPGQGKRPLFDGQFYELPDDVARGLMADGAVAPAEPERAESKMVRPVRDKAMEGPAE